MKQSALAYCWGSWQTGSKVVPVTSTFLVSTSLCKHLSLNTEGTRGLFPANRIQQRLSLMITLYHITFTISIPEKWNENWLVISSQWGNSWELILMAFEAVYFCGQTHFTSYQILLLSSRPWHLPWRFTLVVRKSSLSVHLINTAEKQEFFGLWKRRPNKCTHLCVYVHILLTAPLLSMRPDCISAKYS